MCPKLKEKTGQTPKNKVQHVGAMAFSFGGWDARSNDEIVEIDNHSLGEGQLTPPGAMLLGCPVMPKPGTEKEMAQTSFGEMAFTSFETAYNVEDDKIHHALAGLEDETDGCMVLDCGATKTFGSIKALEKIIEKQGDAGLDTSCVTVDVTDRPNFGFAHGAAEKCSSRATLPLQADGRLGTVAGYALKTKDNRYCRCWGLWIS